MLVNLGGFTALSLCDCDEPVSMVHFKGCNFRCPFCHNKEISKTAEVAKLEDYNWVEIETVEEMIRNSSKLIKGVIFSGGEPTQSPEQLIRLCEYVKSLGLFTGIETNASRPDVINSLIQKDLIDKVFLDIKHPLSDPYGYALITKTDPSFNAATRVKRTLQYCLINDVNLEIRTVAHSQTFRETIEQIKKDVEEIAYNTGGHGMPKFKVLEEV